METDINRIAFYEGGIQEGRQAVIARSASDVAISI